MKPRIVLATLNARYSHASFGLRYLLANLGPWRSETRMREFTIHQPPLEIVERLLDDDPTLIGLGIYIWNLTETTAIMRLLRALRPDLTLVIGGPEVSYEYEGLEAFQLADHLIPGEADLAFRQLVDDLSAGERPPKVIDAPLPDVTALELPYDLYSDLDLAQRLIYVEASRGCPFRCEFCLSSLDIPVRTFDLDRFLTALAGLLERGARAFKFVDRTFNLNVKHSAAILQFCLDHHRDGFELHFEMIPDRLPPELRTLLERFPPGAVQLEIGIQTLSPEVSKRISRPLNFPRIEENFRYLRANTGAHLHADLIFGLPGEPLESFGEGFNRLLDLDPDEIQVGILKRLRGTPISRHTVPFALVFSPDPPYEVLETGAVPFATLQRMKRFARYFDLYHNSGNFLETLRMLLEAGPSPFDAFLRFSDWLYGQSAQTHQFSLSRLCLVLFRFLVDELGLEPASVAERLIRDYDRHVVRRERLEFLKPYAPTIAAPATPTGSLHGQKRRGKSSTPSHPSLPLSQTPTITPAITPAIAPASTLEA